VSAVLAAFDPRAFRWGSASAPLDETLVIVAVCAAMVAAWALGFSYLRRRRRRRMRISDQWNALSAMGELCPTGWQAHITVYGGGAPLPPDAPPSRVPPIALEWKQFDGASGAVVVARRLWAPSVGAALQAMAEDRLTDIALEQIERDIEGRRDECGRRE
jgi:hypothetical protein